MTTLPQFALSVRQPWAWAIIHAGKDIENRNWSRLNATRHLLDFRGPVCIHAAKGMTRDEYESAEAAISNCSVRHTGAAAATPWPHEILRGGIIGTAEIVDVVRKSESPWFFGTIGLVLANARPVEFIPATGALGFFKWQASPEGLAELPARWMLPADQKPKTRAESERETIDRQGALL